MSRRCQWPTCCEFVRGDHFWCHAHWTRIPLDIRHAIRSSAPGTRARENALRVADDIARAREGLHRRYVPDDEIPGMPRS